MSTDDPILAAHTITELMAAIDSVYHLDLPTSIPPDGLLGELWAAGVTVSKGARLGVLYDAEGTASIPIPPAPPATVFVRLEDPDGTDTQPNPSNEHPMGRRRNNV